MKCAICGDEITGKAKRLADGSKVCMDCYESSALIVTCDECGDEVLAANAAKDDGALYCMNCFRQLIRESDFIGEAWKDWEEEHCEEGEETSIDEWAHYLDDNLEDARREYPASRLWMKTAREEVTRIIEAARNTAA